MRCYYLDASALVKRYVDEPGTQWVRAVVGSGEALFFTSRMTIVEVVSAFSRRLRDGTLTAADFATARDMFRSDCLNDYQVMPPNAVVIDQACELLERYSLRAYDAIHLATATTAQEFLTEGEFPSLTFLSADDDLNDAAKAECLAVDNPHRH
ncbi:MAG: type II toxin-antitoxin system VapC family toxin [Chloroflexota bacterium]